MGTALALAAAGYVTGSEPTDPAERALWRTKGIQPQSIRIGDQWISYGRLDPVALIFSMGADINRLANVMNDRQAKAEDVLATMISIVSENLVSKTWLQGVSNALEAFRDPDRYGPGFINRTIGTVVPTLVAQEARAADPVMRDARSVLDALIDRTRYRTELPPRVDLFGRIEDYEKPVGPGGSLEHATRVISPFYVKTEQTGKVDEELWRLQVAKQPPDRKLQGVELTPEQYYQRASIRGRLAYNALDRIVNGPGYDRLVPAARKMVFDAVFQASSSAADLVVLKLNPDLIQTLGQEKVRAIVEAPYREEVQPFAQQMNEWMGRQE
jgi:hypothetical protein